MEEMSTTQSEEQTAGESGASHVITGESGDNHVTNESQQKQPDKESHGENDEGRCSDNPLAFLREEIQFKMLKQVVCENPEMLDTLMKQLHYSNPQLYQEVQKNEQDFRALLHERDECQSEEEEEEVVRDESMEGQKKEGKPLVINVTAAERDSINRLMAMGVPEHQAIQAYFACNKNEEVAAEFLLQQDPIDN